MIKYFDYGFTRLWVIFILTGCLFVSCDSNGTRSSSSGIDRQALVSRHNVKVTSFDTLSSLSVGNGNFAFTVDPTGLQTFPDYYKNGVSLGTQSQWGWHSFPNPNHYSLADATRDYEVNGRKIPYVTTLKSTKRQREASDWLRENPHRLDLGTIGWVLSETTSQDLKRKDIQDIHQSLDLWKGEINSRFVLENQPVEVKTFAEQSTDGIAMSAHSSLFKEGKLGVRILFSYGSKKWDDAKNWGDPDKHQTIILDSNDHQLLLQRILDSTVYYVGLYWKGKVRISHPQEHEFEIFPLDSDSTFEFSSLFSEDKTAHERIEFEKAEAENRAVWAQFWQDGGAVDFSGSSDPRAQELERRIVLSQYLTRIQDAGIFPPQETGLTYNSWYGKFHLEMHFWHEAQFALWNRGELLEKSLPWYEKIEKMARATAEKQGYEGIRWPKMTNPTGRESPSPIGPFLIWQEPHIIFMSELTYRNHPDKETLDKYKDLVFGTADFMASYPHFDSVSNRYILGPALIPAQERYKPDSTINPAFELAYWYWALSVAQEWRERLGLQREPKWDKVMEDLSPLPTKDSVYLATESAPDTYTNPAFITDHPSMLMAYGLLPETRMIDTAIMNNTLTKIFKVWNWQGTWGWDYPVVAMTATRLGRPEDAVRALLMDVTKNTYLPDGHNYQRGNLRIYLPGNGSLLYAVAMMCAGWDGYTGSPNPGFPRDGTWKVKWENLKKVP